MYKLNLHLQGKMSSQAPEPWTIFLIRELETGKLMTP